MRRNLLCIGASVLACAAVVRADAVVGQKDDFDDETTQNWRVGSPAGGSQPVNIASGGPGGANDAYLQMTSVGGNGPLSRLVVFNSGQWGGAYASGINAIEMDLRNLGATELQIRLVFWGNSGDQFSLTAPIDLAVNGAWTHVSVPLQANLFTSALGGGFAETLESVRELRILHSTSASGVVGVPIEGILGIDNVTAVGVTRPPGFADFDNNGVVNHADFLTLHGNFGEAGTFAEGDVSGDGFVNFADFQMLEASFGKTLEEFAAVEAASVPEPGAAVIVTGLMMVMGRRRGYNRGR